MNTPLMPDGKTPLVVAALEYATFAHAGQFRRDGVTPYIEHPKRVAEIVRANGSNDKTQAVANLHDSLEDRPDLSVRDLLEAGFPDDVVHAVELLTKREGEDYKTYLERLSISRMARMVKVADMLANLTDDPTPKARERYIRGIMFLTSVI